MNRTALGVVALAVGAILILGLYNIYKPQTNSMVHDVFHKPNVALENSYMNAPKIGTPVTNRIDYVYKGKVVGNYGYHTFYAKGRYGQKNHINWFNFGYNQMPYNWGVAHAQNKNDTSQAFTFKPNNHIVRVNVLPNYVKNGKIQYVSGNKRISSYNYKGYEKGAYDCASNDAKSVMHNYHMTVAPNTFNFPKGYHLSNGQSRMTVDFHCDNPVINVQISK